MLRTQPGLAPTRKVGRGGFAGAVVTVLVGGLAYAGVQLPVEVATAIGALVPVAVGYFTRERA